MDEALVPTTQRLKIGRSNFRFLSDIKSIESTLQLVYDVLRRCPFFKAFLVTVDVSEIYMQEFWATSTVHYHSIRFKMDTKKHIIDLESFRDILHICPRVHGQPFAEPSFEEEILAFIHFLGHSAAIKMLTVVNINKLYQPWRSFAALINKCLTRKSSGYDNLRLSQAQILWGLYHKRNVDYAYLMWEDFVYQDPSIPKRNKVNWHYVRDDFMFSTIKLVSRHQNKQQFGALLPIELANDEIMNSKAYKEYYAIATGEAAPKPKASTHISQPSGSCADEGTSSKLGVPDVPTDESEEELSWNSTNNEGDDNEGKDDDGDEADEENGDDDDDDEDDVGKEGDDDDADQEVVRDDGKGEEGDGEKDQGLNIGEEERHDEEEEEDELYRDVNINQGRGLPASLEVEDSHVTLTLVKPDGMESIFKTTSQLDVPTPTSVAPLPITTLTMTSSTIATTTTSQAPILPTTALSDIIQHLPISAIPGIVQHYMDQRMNEAVKVAVQIELYQLREEAQRENDEFLRIVDENIKKIIKEQVKEQVKAQVSKILPRIEQAVNEQLKAEALVDAYKSDKIILDTYGEIVTLKRRHDHDEDKDEEPSTGPDRGSKRRREGKEPESASASTETATRSAGRSTKGSRSRQALASESALANEPMQTTSQMEEPSHLEFDTAVHESIQPWISKLVKQADTRSSFNELMDTPLDFSNFIMNRLRVDTLTPELLAGPTYDLVKGPCKSLIELEYHLEEVYKAKTDQLDWVNPEGQQYPHNLLQPLSLIPDNRGRRVIPFAYFINNDLEYLRASSRKYTTSVTKTKASDYRYIKWIEDLVPRTMWIQEPIDYDKHALWGVSHWGRKHQQFYGFAVNRESARDVYSKRRIIAVTELKIRRVEDLQLGVKSYQKRLNLTKPDTYWSDLKRKEAYTAYSNLRGFIYQNKDKKNRLMRIDELHKFSDGTLTNVRTALDDHLKGIRMRYLPQTI
nr:hypothetical protein [Tanacetum cinerariifolium]